MYNVYSIANTHWQYYLHFVTWGQSTLNMDLNHEFPIQFIVILVAELIHRLFIVMSLPHTDIHMPLRVMVIHFPLVLRLEHRFSVHITQFNNTLSPIIGSIHIIFFLNACKFSLLWCWKLFQDMNDVRYIFWQWILVARQVCSIITMCTW